jgi:hypothetical protein
VKEGAVGSRVVVKYLGFGESVEWWLMGREEEKEETWRLGIGYKGGISRCHCQLMMAIPLAEETLSASRDAQQILPVSYSRGGHREEQRST